MIQPPEPEPARGVNHYSILFLEIICEPFFCRFFDAWDIFVEERRFKTKATIFSPALKMLVGFIITT